MSIISNIINVYIAPSKVFKSVKDFNWKKALIPILILAIVGVLSYWFIQDLATDFGYNKAVSTINMFEECQNPRNIILILR